VSLKRERERDSVRWEMGNGGDERQMQTDEMPKDKQEVQENNENEVTMYTKRGRGGRGDIALDGIVEKERREENRVTLYSTSVR
jgi:hypothetical protein